MSKKRVLTTLLVVSSLLFVPLTHAQGNEDIVATYKHKQQASVTQAQLEHKVYAVQMIARKKLVKRDKERLIKSMVKQRLLEQAANHEGINVTEQELGVELVSFKKMIEQNMKQSLGWQEFETFLRTRRDGFYDFVKQDLTRKIKIAKFYDHKIQPEKIKVPKIDKKAIEQYYQANLREFEVPTKSTIEQIILEKPDTEDMEAFKQNLATIQARLNKGETISQLANDRKINGVFTHIQHQHDIVHKRDDNGLLLYGQKFLFAVDALKKGKVSMPLDSKIGVHFVEVKDRSVGRQLKLKDSIPPKNELTVEQKIAELITDRKKKRIYEDKRFAISQQVIENSTKEYYTKNM